MAKRDKIPTAKVLVSSKPKKIVFGDDGAPEATSGTTPSVPGAVEDDVESLSGSEESDEDDAPEEIGTVAVRRAAQKEEKDAAALRRAVKQARSLKAEATKLKKAALGKSSSATDVGLKRKSKGSRQDLAEASESNASDVAGSDEESASEDGFSFHTASEDEDGSEDDEDEGMEQPLSGGSENGQVDSKGSSDEDEDDSEAFSDEDEQSLDPETRRLRARMQAAMEAAESQDKAKSTPNAREKPTRTDKGKKVAVSEEDDWAQFNMIPGVAPLSSSLLESARVAEERGRKAVKRQAEFDAVAERKMKKRKKTRQDDDVVSRTIDGFTTVALLPPPPTSALSPSAIPRITTARQDLGSQKKSSTFLREAMKRSGSSSQARQVSGKGSKAKADSVPLSGGRVPAHIATARGAARPAAHFRRTNA